jgi:hypothetical protein
MGLLLPECIKTFCCAPSSTTTAGTRLISLQAQHNSHDLACDPKRTHTHTHTYTHTHMPTRARARSVSRKHNTCVRVFRRERYYVTRVARRRCVSHDHENPLLINDVLFTHFRRPSLQFEHLTARNFSFTRCSASCVLHGGPDK